MPIATFPLAARFPQTRFLMIHMGGAGLPPLDRAAIEVAAQYPNIMLIGSAIGERAISSWAVTCAAGLSSNLGRDQPIRVIWLKLTDQLAIALLIDWSIGCIAKCEIGCGQMWRK